MNDIKDLILSLVYKKTPKKIKVKPKKDVLVHDFPPPSGIEWMHTQNSETVTQDHRNGGGGVPSHEDGMVSGFGVPPWGVVVSGIASPPPFRQTRGEKINPTILINAPQIFRPSYGPEPHSNSLNAN